MQKQSHRHKENIKKTKNTVYSNIEEAIEILKESWVLGALRLQRMRMALFQIYR